MEITSIEWENSPLTSTDADCEGFTLHLGHCSSDVLSDASFEGNYITGTKTLCYSTSNLHIDMNDQWHEIVLDTPFAYNGTDNLIIEIQWDNGTEDNSYYNWNWDAGNGRCIYQQQVPGINLFNLVPHMILNGSLALDGTTFGAIKVELGR